MDSLNAGAVTNSFLPAKNILSANRNIYVDYHLRVLTSEQRLALVVTISIVIALAIIGNFATIIVNFKRKIRPLFRTCLISLALSDLLTAIFQSTSYMAQLSIEFAPVWILSHTLCYGIPFITTLAVLVNSFTLVGIAMDRYFAVVKIIKGGWEPSPIICSMLAIIIWGVAAGVSCPMLRFYYPLEMTLIITNPANRSEQIGVSHEVMCTNIMSSNLIYYYPIVFVVIFLPMVLAFVCLNTIIAIEIWRRRKPIEMCSTNSGDLTSSTITSTGNTQKQLHPKNLVIQRNQSFEDVDISTDKRTSETNAVSNEIVGKLSACITESTNTNPQPTSIAMKNRSNREIRQLRMFRVIVILMLAFLICRLPTWIYLLYKLNNMATTNMHWVLHYVLGTLSIFNGVLNPLLYTFLTETIQISFNVIDRLREWFMCRCFHRLTPVGEPIPKMFYCSEDRKTKTARI